MDNHSLYTSLNPVMDALGKSIGKNDAEAEVPPLETGFRHLRLKKGCLTLFGMQKNSGIASLAYSMILNIGVENKKPVGLVSAGLNDTLGMGNRLLSMQAQVPIIKMRNGMLSDRDSVKLKSAMKALAESPVFVRDEPNGCLETMTKIIEGMVQNEKVEAVFIDSLDFLDEIANEEKYPDFKWEPYFSVKASLLESYRNLAKRLNIAIIILAETKDDDGSLPGSPEAFKKEIAVTRIVDTFVFLSKTESEDGAMSNEANISLWKKGRGTGFSVCRNPQTLRYEDSAQ